MLKVAELFADLLLNTSSYNKSLNVAVASARTAANNISKIMATSLNGVTARANKMGAALTEALRNRPLAATKSLAAAISKVSTSLETAVGPRALSNLQLVTASLSSATRAMQELSTQASRARNTLSSIRVPAARPPRATTTTTTTTTATATVTPAVAAGQALSQVLENQIPRAARRASRSVQDANQSMQKSFKDTARIIQGILISQGFYAMIRSIKEATAAVIDFSQNMEQAAISYSILLGSQDKADRFLNVLKQFAAVTPFTVDTASDMARRLLAMGFAAESIIPTMQTLTDASAVFGGTAEQLDRIVLALGQIKTKGKIEGQEIRQLAEAGIPAYRILQEELGLTREQLADIGNLKISGDLGVSALLKGMEKRYKGASDRISRTMRGLFSTIKDNLLILSEAIFAGPYEKFRQFAQKVVNVLNSMRETFDRTGLGGLFESLIPPRLQQNVRTVIASIQSLVESFKILWRAVQPVVQALGEYLVKALSMVLPVIAGIVRGIANFVKAITSSVPAIRILIGTIAGLLIASTVATVIAKLAIATKLLGIAQAVGRAVLFLAKAIQVLYVACARNPITAIILIVSTALLGLALSSETASKWLDAVIQRLGKLAGLKTEGLLNPTSTKEIADQMNEFNKSLIDSQKDLKGVGKAAADTQKKTDKFLASFDEVYQVPENLDDVAEGLEGIGDQLPDLEDIKLPEIDMGMDTAIPDIGDSIADQLKNIPPLVLPKWEWPAPPSPPSIPPGAAAVVTDGFFAELGKRFVTAKAQIADGLTKFVATEIPGLITAGQPFILTAIEAYFLAIPIAVGKKLAEAGQAIYDFFTVTVPGYVTAAIPIFEAALELFFVLIPNKIGEKLAAAGEAVFNFFTVTVPGWVTEAVPIFVAALELFFVTIPNKVAEKLKLAGDAIYDFFTVKVPAWVTDSLETLIAALELVFVTIPVKIGKKLVEAGELVYNFFSQDVPQGITENVPVIVTALGGLLVAMMTAFTDKFKEMGNLVTKFFKEDIPNWIKTHQPTVLTTLGVFLTAFKQSITDQFKRAGEVVVKFFKEDIPNWISVHKPGILLTLGLLLAAIVAAIVAMFVSVPAAIAGALAAIVIAVTTAFKVDMIDGIKQAFGQIPGKLLAIKDELFSTAQRVASAITEPFTSAFSSIKTALSNIGKGVSTTVASIGLSTSGVKGYATGGIIDREQIVRVGERDKREAIIPLESSAMKPFAQAVAQELGGMGTARSSGTNNDTRPILYVGTLIADDRSLKELERKMEVIRIQEAQRKGA